MKPGRNWCLALGGLLLAAAALLMAAPGAHAGALDLSAGQARFGQSCASCHSIGGGKRVGPDLQGVTQRRDDAWLRSHIKAPSAHREAGDPIALANVEEFKMRMPDLGLTDAQVESVVAYLKTATKTPLPEQYVPTLAIGLLGIVALTLVGLLGGRKKVEVRS